MNRSIINDVIIALLVFLFVYAAFSKLADYHKFVVQLGQSPMLTAFAAQIAWCVPLLEISIAVLLTTEGYRLVGLMFSFGLLVIFSAYIVAITQYSVYVPCSCGGILQKMTWNQHLVFNIFFMLLAALAVLNHSPSPSKLSRTAMA